MPRRFSPVIIQRPAYAMASTDGQTAEITMYGDIVESTPTDWWGDPVEGSFITLGEFLKDLEQVEACTDITIRMNSYGGDAGVSCTIHNRLRELARNGTTLHCIVDGVAMSGGSLIMCACDDVKVNPSSLIMIHKCWSFMFGGYNADEMRAAAQQNDAWDQMQVEVYKRKTGLSETVIKHMMADTTYMTGREAVEKGFANEVLEDADPLEIAASADGRSLFVHGRQMHMAPGMFAPDTIPTVTPAAAAAVEANTNQPEENPGNQEGGQRPMAKTVEELRQESPDLVTQIEESARAAAAADAGTSAADERRRIQEIDAIADQLDPALVEEAKYGENACTAQELALRAVQQAQKIGGNFLRNMQADAHSSGTEDVGAAPAPTDDPTGGEPSVEKIEAEAQAAVNAWKKSKEGK